jgi:peptidoglycan/LPS O-acetylase OafA/YrhL
MNRRLSLDLARFLAAYLVLFGHLVLGGTFDTDIPYLWVNKQEMLPLLDQTKQSLWSIDFYLLTKFHTASAIIGVALFFLISGIVIPPMIDKYPRSFFLVNRIARIFPMLICAVFFAAILQYFSGDSTKINLWDVISTMTLTNQFTGKTITLGVVWTLLVEFKFYLLLCVLGKLDDNKILLSTLSAFIVLGLFFLILKIDYFSINERLLILLKSLIADFCYMIFMLSATILFLKTEKNIIYRIMLCITMMILFNIYRLICIMVLDLKFNQNINILTQIITIIILAMCFFIERLSIKENKLLKLLSSISLVTYSLYLIHVPLGYYLISILRHSIDNQYILLLSIIIIISCISSITYKIIEIPFNIYIKKILAKLVNKS